MMKWCDYCCKVCGSFEEGLQLLNGGAHEFMFESAKGAYNRKLDEGFRLVTPVAIVEYGVGFNNVMGHYIYLETEAEIEPNESV